jgi:hypothetical protein
MEIIIVLILDRDITLAQTLILVLVLDIVTAIGKDGLNGLNVINTAMVFSLEDNCVSVLTLILVITLDQALLLILDLDTIVVLLLTLVLIITLDQALLLTVDIIQVQALMLDLVHILLEPVQNLIVIPYV